MGRHTIKAITNAWKLNHICVTRWPAHIVNKREALTTVSLIHVVCNFLHYNSYVIAGNLTTFYSTITFDQIILQIKVHWLLLHVNIQNAVSSHRLPKKIRCLSPLKSRSPLKIPKHDYICLFLSIHLKKIYICHHLQALFGWKTILLDTKFHSRGNVEYVKHQYSLSFFAKNHTLKQVFSNRTMIFFINVVFQRHMLLYSLKSCFRTATFCG